MSSSVCPRVTVQPRLQSNLIFSLSLFIVTLFLSKGRPHPGDHVAEQHLLSYIAFQQPDRPVQDIRRTPAKSRRKPPGRIPVDTRAPDEDTRDAVYGFLRRQIEAGRQAYVVCPLIEEGEDDGLKAVDAFSRELKKKYFPDIELELMHGRLTGREKDAIMQRFAEGKTKILVSTTVIEVGVNIPNANMIVVENAERFGLSQPHQLRGRVGRSSHKSYCVLLSSSHSAATAGCRTARAHSTRATHCSGEPDLLAVTEDNPSADGKLDHAVDKAFGIDLGFSNLF